MKFALLTILMTLVLAGCGEQPSVPTAPVAAVVTRKTLSVLISGDTRGWLMPCGCTSNQSGGLLRRATWVEQVKRETDVLVLECGGAADGTAPYQQSRFRAILMGEKLMGLSAHNVGISEAVLGADTLKQLASDTGVEFISANVQHDGSPFTAKYKLITQSGHTLLITGVCSQKLLADADNVPPSISVGDPASAILSVINEAAAPDAVVLVLAWLPEDEMRQLAETMPEIHVLVGGPTGQSVPPQMVGRTLMMSATNKGKFVARVPLADNGELPKSAEIVELSPSIADEAGQKKNLDTFRAMLLERDFTAAESGFGPKSVLAETTKQHIAGSESCRACHTAACDVWNDSPHHEAWAVLEPENGHVDPFCQQCHSTGYGLDSGFVSLRKSPDRINVGCESCHGPSSQHVSEPRTRTPFDAKGGCTRCHDHENSPQFSFAEYWEKILHE